MTNTKIDPGDHIKEKISAANIRINSSDKRAPDSSADLSPSPQDSNTPGEQGLSKGSLVRSIKLGAANWASLPDQPSSGNVPPMTINNLRHLMAANSITIRYNIIKKKTEITIPDQRGTADNLDNVALTHVISLVAKAGLPTGLVASYVAALGDENAYNPVADWINEAQWDGADRLQAIFDTLTVKDEFPEELKIVLVRKWLLSAVAAVLSERGFRSRGVLTLQGRQSLGKSQWVASLVPAGRLRNSWVKVDHHLDAYNKDSILGACTHWICEVGELDSSLKRDVARIKGVLTRDSDKVRVPYARTESEYQRRTGINMQQLFAQLACQFRAGEQWWLTEEEEALLDAQNRQHRSTTAVEERLMEVLDLTLKDELRLPKMTATQLLNHIGYPNPTNPQCKECAAVLREHLGDPRRINGENKWSIPLPLTERPELRTAPKDKFD
jgi:putative DNA primase/helicase